MHAQSLPWRTRPTWLCWSGGKESAWALQELRADPSCDVRGLIALVNEENGRVILHGVRHTLLQRQAEALDLPLRFIPLDWTCSVTERNAALARGFGELRTNGAERIAFGDLLSVRGRERRLLVTAESGLETLSPLWKRDTRRHARDLVEAGLSAWICSVDTDCIPADRVGRRFDEGFLAGLPEGIDPCGGKGEFHTFVDWAQGWNRRVEVAPTRMMEVYDFAFAEMGPPPKVEATARAQPDDGMAEAWTGDGSSAEPAVDPFSHFARLDRIRRYVDGHIADDLDAAAVASVAAMSRTGFARFFREHVGMTFRAWLLHRRVERACQLLRENNIAVSRIGEAAGFHSERTFRRAFYEQMECSPSKYRKRSLEE